MGAKSKAKKNKGKAKGKKGKGTKSTLGAKPKKKCCDSRPKCARCPLRMLKEGTLPEGYAVQKRRLVKVGGGTHQAA